MTKEGHKKYRVLVLTDHSTHTANNSLYALVRSMAVHPQCLSIDIASRGIFKNVSFFSEMKTHDLYVSRVGSDFQFSQPNEILNKGAQLANIDNYNLVLLRLPRPVSDEFLYWIENTFQHCTIINRPSGIVKTSNKIFLENFSALCPPMQFCQKVEDIVALSTDKTIVLKPLREHGGKGLLKVSGNVLDDGNQLHDTQTYLNSIADTILKDGYLAMDYLKNVTEGDKRIIVVGNEIMAASLRMPAKDSWICNVARGGSTVTSIVTDREKYMVQQIAPVMNNQGILIYGIDTLTDDSGKRVLSEINTLSIGGFPQAEQQTGLPIIKKTIDKLFKYADEHR